jgi:hypothetical protein
MVERHGCRRTPPEHDGNTTCDAVRTRGQGTVACIQHLRDMVSLCVPILTLAQLESSICYAYAVRYFATSPLCKAAEGDNVEIRQTLSQLMPFLVDRKSKLAHTNLSSVVTDVWSRFQQVGHGFNVFYNIR